MISLIFKFLITPDSSLKTSEFILNKIEKLSSFSFFWKFLFFLDLVDVQKKPKRRFLRRIQK